MFGDVDSRLLGSTNGLASRSTRRRRLKIMRKGKRFIRRPVDGVSTAL